MLLGCHAWEFKSPLLLKAAHGSRAPKVSTEAVGALIAGIKKGEAIITFCF